MRRRVVSSSSSSASAAAAAAASTTTTAAGSTSRGSSHSSRGGGGGGKGGRVRVTTSNDASAHLDLISSLVLGGADGVPSQQPPPGAAAAAAVTPAAGQQQQQQRSKVGKENRTPITSHSSHSSSCGRTRCSGAAATPPAAAATSTSKPTTTRPSPSPFPVKPQQPQSAAQLKAALRVTAREVEGRIVAGAGDEEVQALRRSVRRLWQLAEQAVESCGRMEAQLLTSAATMEASEAQTREAQAESAALAAELKREREGREALEGRVKGVVGAYWRERAVLGRVMEAVATLALSEAQHDGPEEGGAALGAILALQGQAAACLNGNPLVGVDDDEEGVGVDVDLGGEDEEDCSDEMY